MRRSIGVTLIEKERAKQKRMGYTIKHDDSHTDSSMATAAACYAAPMRIFRLRDDGIGSSISLTDPWPWLDYQDARKESRGDQRGAFRPLNDRVRIRELTKAGALIVAEIERLSRQKKRFKIGNRKRGAKS